MKKVCLILAFLLGLFANESDLRQIQKEIQQKQPVNQEQSNNQKEEQKEIFYNRNGFVIGVFGGASFIQAETEYDAFLGDFDFYDRKKLMIAPNYGIKLGYDIYFLPKHGMRIYADYIGSNFLNENNIVGKVNTHTLALNVEYKYEITEKFGVFAGANINYTLFDTQYFGLNGGFGFGVNAGFTYAVFSFMELELGVKYLGDSFREKTHLPDSSAPAGLPIPPTSQKTDLGDFVGVRFGINFKI